MTRQDLVDLLSPVMDKYAEQEYGIKNASKLSIEELEEKQESKEAIDEKISSEQRAQQMVYVLQKEKQEAERKRVEAEGIAQAQKIISNTTKKPIKAHKTYIQPSKDSKAQLYTCPSR